MPDAPSKKNIPLALAALGVVFGDIGTSPLYAFQTALGALTHPGRDGVLGVASLIIWSLLLLVSGKYILIVMRADYRGEGGVFALLALLKKASPKITGLKLPLYAILLLFGAAMLYGDGTITPAISVLSAMEGLETIHPDFKAAVLPGTVAILLVLFFVQRMGTGRLGAVFGWVMLLWFLTIGIMGAWWMFQRPEILSAFNPMYAFRILREEGMASLVLMGAVVLAVTGVEALYADMGHFNRRAISLAWHVIVLPALLLNYLGQAGMALGDPVHFATNNTFFLMLPSGWPILALVILATLATVIASQALISGAFSLTAQAMELGYLPRFQIIHTSRNERGQVYVPITNWLLAIFCIVLVLTFRSSDNLAAAYGLAVVCTMLITSISIGLIAVRCWKWQKWQGASLSAAFLVIEVPFFLSCLTKVPEGGYFPLLIGTGLMMVMLTWWKGRAIIREHLTAGKNSAEALRDELASGRVLCSPGQIVFLTTQKDPHYAAARAFELMRRGGALREQVVVMSLIGAMSSDVDMPQCVEVSQLGEKFWHVTAKHGFMQEPHAPEILAQARQISHGGIAPGSDDTFYILPREMIIEHVGNRLVRWQRSLFGFLSRNVSYAPDYFYIPQSQIIEFTWMMRA